MIILCKMQAALKFNIMSVCVWYCKQNLDSCAHYILYYNNYESTKRDKIKFYTNRAVLDNH